MEDELEFYRDKDGKIKYANKCRHCTKSCRQSFRVQIIRCPNYQEIGSTKELKSEKQQSLGAVENKANSEN